MDKSKMLLKIEARSKSIWNQINATDPEILNSLLVSPSDLQKKLDSLDEEVIINQFVKELQESFDLINRQTVKYQAVNYVWYQQDNWAVGKAYEKCTYKFLSGEDTDPNNNWTVFNSQKPDLSGQSIDLGKLSVTLVMLKWYDELLTENQKDEYDADDYDNLHMIMFDELFKLKLFNLLDIAYSRIIGDKPDYFCVSVYGYWFSEISEYIIEPHD